MSIPGPVSPDVLSIHGVSKAFGAVQALSDVSIDCRAGEIHALVGENGSGKSTLLGIASGFLAPDEGTVEIGGSRLQRHAPAAARRLGLGSSSRTGKIATVILRLLVAARAAQWLFATGAHPKGPAYASFETLRRVQRLA